MAPLQGDNLGQRHKYYNELLKQAIANKTSDIPKINYEEDDVDNMIKIDMACKDRNVEYILEVFKCDDMLYVSRAINKSTWLIKNPQYSHIVNPKWLHDKLFPEMNAKAVTKFMLRIRRHLRDEVRVQAFYSYVNQKDPAAALHWLGNCSVKFIEKTVAARANDIPAKLLKRFCRHSFPILRLYLKNFNSLFNYCNIIEESTYYLKNKKTAAEFLDLVYDNRNNYSLRLNAKHTRIVMRLCPAKIKDDFMKFYEHIDVGTFAKYIKVDEIRSFFSSVSNGWWSYENLSPFLVKLPRDEVLDFLRSIYKIEHVDSNEKEKSDVEALFYSIEGRAYYDFSNVYRWYRFAPFDIAFRDIKKFIYAESEPEKRHAMLNVLLSCAGYYDYKHVNTVIQYYHDKHINEPYLHKKTFLNSVLDAYFVFSADESDWNLLNALFHSSEVYIESTNEVQACLMPIIVRDVLRDKPVHEVVEEKFEFDTLACIRCGLNPEEQEKVFNYLYNLLLKKISLQKTDSETGMRNAVKLVKTLWTLINDWDRAESHHRYVIEKVAELGEINQASSWIKEMRKRNRRKRRKHSPYISWHNAGRRRHVRSKPTYVTPYIDVPSLYKMLKLYRKGLFEMSVVLNPSEDVLLNALKHDPGLLTRNKSEIDFLRSNDEVSLNRFLSKLRTYWSNSLALEWTETNRECLKKLSGHRALVRGILKLMPQKEVLDLIKIYAPKENKFDWAEINKIDLSITKHFAKNMHIARPQLPAEVVLWYAKGDYLQFTLLALRTMYYNLRSKDIRKYITLMLNAPVSMQKHGIRLVFDKYKTEEIIEIASTQWKKTKNSSIRATLFTRMFKLLCNEKKAMAIKAIWSVLSSFVDDLNEEENKNIYETLAKVDEVPLSVVGEFYQKAFLFLKSLPEKSDMKYTISDIVKKGETFIEYLDFDFVEKSLLIPITKALANYSDCSEGVYLRILSAYLLCSKDLEIQMRKYNNLLQPVIEEYVPKWAGGDKNLIDGFQTLLTHICSRIPHFVFGKKMIMPVEISANITGALLKGVWCIKEHYIMVRRWQLTIRYIEVLGEMHTKEEEQTWETVKTESTKHIASICLKFITEDEVTFFPSIYLIFKPSLQHLFSDFGLNNEDQCKALYEMLNWPDHPSMYLLVLEVVLAMSSKNHWINEIKEKGCAHGSQEVAMHYLRKFTDKVCWAHSTGAQDLDWS